MSSSDGTRDGGPAFPINELNQQTGNVFAQHMGLTLRDYFAAQVLPHLTSLVIPEWQLKAWFGDRGGLRREEIAARAAYEYANAMLKARGAAP